MAEGEGGAASVLLRAAGLLACLPAASHLLCTLPTAAAQTTTLRVAAGMRSGTLGLAKLVQHLSNRGVRRADRSPGAAGVPCHAVPAVRAGSPARRL